MNLQITDKFAIVTSSTQGWDSLINGAVGAARTGARSQRTRRGTFNSSDLNFYRQGMSYLWGALLCRLDVLDSQVDGTETTV